MKARDRENVGERQRHRDTEKTERERNREIDIFMCSKLMMIYAGNN